MNPPNAVQTCSPSPVDARQLFDISDIDLSQRALTKAELEKWIPHRGTMSLLDGVAWHDEGFVRGVAVKPVREDEFWVSGHFPGRPMMPGVLMIEAGAQLASFLFHSRRNEDCIAGFTRIENAVFRDQVLPGQDLILLAQEVKYQPRRFISDVQGLHRGKLAFEARITGMVL